MLRYEIETRPGLLSLYDIQPGNGAGPFLQPRSPHGAASQCKMWLLFLILSARMLTRDNKNFASCRFTQFFILYLTVQNAQRD